MAALGVRFARITIPRRLARRAIQRAMLRRHLSVLCCLAVCAAGASWAQEQEPDRPTEPFDRALLEARAAELATRPHSLPPRPEGEGRERLTYDQYRSIRFDPTAAIWGRENRTFAVDLLYPGFIFDVPVNINLVVGRTARRVLFTNERFAYGPDVPLVAPTAGTPAIRASGCAHRSTRPTTSTSSSCSRARATSAASRKTSSTACRRAVSPSARRGPKARNSPRSRTSGSSARRSRPSRSSFTRCCRAHRSSVRTRSRLGPATKPSSTSV